MTPERRCANCVFAKKLRDRGFPNYYYALRCKTAGDIVSDVQHCNAWEEATS